MGFLGCCVYLLDFLPTWVYILLWGWRNTGILWHLCVVFLICGFWCFADCRCFVVNLVDFAVFSLGFLVGSYCAVFSLLLRVIWSWSLDWLGFLTFWISGFPGFLGLLISGCLGFSVPLWFLCLLVLCFAGIFYC